MQDNPRRLVAPELEPTPRLLEEIHRRASAVIRTATEARYREAVAAWAVDDAAPYPLRSEVEAEVVAEFEHLCRGLGRWAAVPPHELWEPDHCYDTLGGWSP